MEENKLSVRELKHDDVKRLVDYWLLSDSNYLTGMGVDLSKMPSREQMTAMISEQLDQPYPEKKAYCIIWELDHVPVGHCNVNKISYGEEAYMHLHAWHDSTRRRGFGSRFVKMSIPYFFSNLKLKKVFCETYALNLSPNKTLLKAGFEFEKEYITIPGYLNFEQPANRWVLSQEKFNDSKR